MFLWAVEHGKKANTVIQHAVIAFDMKKRDVTTFCDAVLVDATVYVRPISHANLRIVPCEPCQASVVEALRLEAEAQRVNACNHAGLRTGDGRCAKCGERVQ